MVFVSVGTASQGFPRLLRAVDDLAARGLFEGERVVAQIGSTRGIEMCHCDSVDFLPRDDFENYLRAASVVICHGGSLLLDLARLQKVPAVMPRRKKYGEAINDHQVQFAEALAAAQRVVIAHEAGDLRDAIIAARGITPPSVPKADIVELVRGAIEELIGGDAGRD